MIKKKLDKILVPLDGSKNSMEGLEEAIYLARQCSATITGLFVVPIYPMDFGQLLRPFKRHLFKKARKIMGEAKTHSAQNGIVFYDKIIYGDPAWDIVNMATKKKFDLIVIGSRGLGPVKKLVLGSVANSVVNKSTVPVLVVK